MNKILEFMNTPYYWIIILIIFLIELYILRKMNIIIGAVGEYYARKELKNLPKDKYKILNDIMIELNGYTHQIDHIVVSSYGIFVIETKQYNGNIYGSKYDKKWIRRCRNKDYHYTNPIRQNYGHVKTICELLNLNESVVYNIVYIPSTAKLKIEHDGELVLADELCKKIISYQTPKLNNIDEIIEKINKNNITDRKKRKEHIKRVKKEMEKLGENCCPKCGKELKERKGKYGVFYGCSNYPKCRYTVKNK